MHHALLSLLTCSCQFAVEMHVMLLQIIAILAAHLGSSDLATHNSMAYIFMVVTSAMLAFAAVRCSLHVDN